MTNTDKLAHSASATKELIAIVMALAAANVVSQFIAIHDRVVIDYILLVAILLSVVRFYHGNVLTIDRHFSTGVPDSVSQGVTFFVVLVQSFLFTFIPYFFAKPSTLFLLVGLIFILDVVWYVPILIWAPDKNRHEKVWACLALFGGAFILIVFNFKWNQNAAVIGVLVGTTVLDYIINWRDLYFPAPGDKLS